MMFMMLMPPTARETEAAAKSSQASARVAPARAWRMSGGIFDRKVVRRVTPELMSAAQHSLSSAGSVTLTEMRSREFAFLCSPCR